MSLYSVCRQFHRNIKLVFIQEIHFVRDYRVAFLILFLSPKRFKLVSYGYDIIKYTLSIIFVTLFDISDSRTEILAHIIYGMVLLSMPYSEISNISKIGNPKCAINCVVFISWLGGRFPVATHFKKAWWRHQMDTFSALLAICAGNSPVPLTKASDAELLCFLWSTPK